MNSSGVTANGHSARVSRASIIAFRSGLVGARKAHFPVARAEGEEVAQRDRAVGGHRIVEGAVDRAQDLAVGQLGQPFVDRIVEPELALLDEDHGADRRDRLGHRGEPEDRVPPHRHIAAEGHRADRLHVLPAAVVDERDEAREHAAVDVASQGRVHAVQPRWEKPPRSIAGRRVSVVPWS